MSSDGKFIWGDRVITPENTTGVIVGVSYNKNYDVKVGEKISSYSEDELVINW